MSTDCIKVTMDENPLDVLKGCSCILSSLEVDFVEDNYSHYAIAVISDLLTDATSRIEEKLKDGSMCYE